jgi:spermidine synthase
MDFDTPYEGQIHAIQEFLVSHKTAFQKMDVVITHGYGKALLLDGRIQSSQKDEYIYHESLVHPVMISGKSPVRVLVVGGGEGSTLREVLKYPSVKEAVMVDIDREVVEACKIHLPEFHQGSFDDPRTKVIIDDGRAYIQNSGERFDVVILDIPEPTEGGPAYSLFTAQFYRLVKKVLRDGGRIVTQACTSSIRLIDNFSVICNTVAEVFGSVQPYHCFIPSFGYTWGFALWAPGIDDMASLDVDERLQKYGLPELKYYDEVTNRSLFCLPRDVRKIVSEETRVFFDETPPHI